jgi:transposase
MLYVGLDVHKEFTTIGQFDPATGELTQLGEVATEKQQLIEALERLPAPRTAVLEAGRKSHWVAAMVESAADEVWIVDPLEVRRLQGRRAKTDRRDATGLAWWAAKGVLTPLWRPKAQTMDLRELTRGRIAMVRLTTRVRNIIRALCARHGEELPKGDLLGASAQKRLAELQLPGFAGLLLGMWRELLPILQQFVDRFEGPLQQAAAADPQAQRLMSLPGVGEVLALTMAVEIGEIERFDSPAQLRSYSGLCPRVSRSAARNHLGPLTKAGNRWLRYGVMLAAQQVPRARYPDRRLKRLYQRVAFGHGRNPAKVACARSLLDLIHHLLSNQEDYQLTPRRLAA